MLTRLGVSRCFPFWQEYLACYIVNQNEESRDKKTCVPVLEDYYECLHHRKEVLPTHPGFGPIEIVSDNFS
jgi:NADH dehydrogenase (ubiquinone) Fe-S protein 5